MPLGRGQTTYEYLSLLRHFTSFNSSATYPITLYFSGCVAETKFVRDILREKSLQKKKTK